MARWEYAALKTGARVGFKREEEALDRFGGQGWELVAAVTDAEASTFFYFKRRVPWFAALWRWLSRKRGE
jgi:hypothetical protein